MNGLMRSNIIWLILAIFSITSCKHIDPQQDSQLAATEDDSIAMRSFFSVNALNAVGPLPLQFSIPLNEIRNAARMSGSTQITANTTFKLFPSEEFGVVDLYADIEAYTQVTAQQQGVSVNSEVLTQTTAVKRIYIGEKSIGTHNTIFRNTRASSDLRSIQASGIFGGRLKRRIASRKYYEMTPAIQAQAKQLLERQAKEQIDSSITPVINQANSVYQKTVRKLINDGRFPGIIKYKTTSDKVYADVVKASQVELASRPHLPSADLGFQVHQSILNEFADTHLAGKEFDAEHLKKTIKDLPIDIQFNNNNDIHSIKGKVLFARNNPLRFYFKNNKITIVIYAKFNLALNDTNADIGPYYTQIDYKIIDGNNGAKIFRRLDPIISENPLAQQDSQESEQAEQQSKPQPWYQAYAPTTMIKNAVGNYFRKVFIEQIIFKPLPVYHVKITSSSNTLQSGSSNGALIPTHVLAQNGWLSLAWTHNPEFEVALEPAQTCHFGTLTYNNTKICAYWMPGHDRVFDYIDLRDGISCSEATIKNDEYFNQKKFKSYCPKGQLINKQQSPIYQKSVR